MRALEQHARTHVPAGSHWRRKPDAVPSIGQQVTAVGNDGNDLFGHAAVQRQQQQPMRDRAAKGRRGRADRVHVRKAVITRQGGESIHQALIHQTPIGCSQLLPSESADLFVGHSFPGHLHDSGLKPELRTTSAQAARSPASQRENSCEPTIRAS